MRSAIPRPVRVAAAAFAVAILASFAPSASLGVAEAAVTKTTAGVIVLPRDHHVMERKLKPPHQQAAIGKSACDQCRYCTEYCPRFLLGYAVEPHQVMRSLAFTATGRPSDSRLARHTVPCRPVPRAAPSSRPGISGGACDMAASSRPGADSVQGGQAGCPRPGT